MRRGRDERELLARDLIRDRISERCHRRRDPVGIQRSARLVAEEIRASRRHHPA